MRRRIVFSLWLFGFVLYIPAAYAQPCPTPQVYPEPNDVTGWANSINHCLPQAIPAQIVGLGTFDTAPPPYQGMFWRPDLVPCVMVGPIGGFDRACTFPPPSVQIQSYNVQYQIALRNKPANYDLQATLTIPTLQGTRDYSGTVDATGTLLTIDFHPDTIGTQTLKFSHAGTQLASYEITTTLQPQLGAFIVPYLPVAVVYQPPGSQSTAQYNIGHSIGTKLCWGTSSTSGNFKTENSSFFFGHNTDLVSGIAAAAGVVGAIPQLAGGKAIEGVLKALVDAYDIHTTSGSTDAQGQTLCRGMDVTTSVSNGTAPGQSSDLYLLRKNALFVYVVVLKDPSSGNTVPTNGVPTVVLTLVHSDPLPPLNLTDLQSDYPADVLDTLATLDLQLNPLQLKHLIWEAQHTTIPSPVLHGWTPPVLGGGTHQHRRLKYLTNVSPQYCSTNMPTKVSWQTDFYTSSDVSTATTQTVTTNVTGYLATLMHQTGTVTQSITLSSDQSVWQSYSESSEIDLLCPEIDPPYKEWKMDIYLDTVFGTLIAYPVEKLTTTNPAVIGGIVVDNAGTRVGGLKVKLEIGGKTYSVRTNADGTFAFRIPNLPNGQGTIAAEERSVVVSYNGSPVNNVRVKLPRRVSPR